MLEVRNLTKVYKPKKGVPVLAVDHVNLRFPDKGMVFLLGKSGSGKSTMLNLLGGLDIYDDGEIIIKGKSSKNFKQKDFDSYRNTYLGFIFQEYNILEEFNVGANIALALQLQSQKVTDEKINQILEQVDLAGYGNRKPNELSGGQKQRVAIARALVKDPEIIMADEPTGALDSVTGKQVLDTLKKLSRDKLVIVVSHDREFAEHYADRIIEMSDGHVISDMEYFGEEVDASNEGLTFGSDSILVAPQYHLTQADLDAINEWLEVKGNGGTIAVGNQSDSYVLRSCTPTDESRIIPQIAGAFRLIKSKLPMRNAFKIGASGLKHKKFRLVITILLSCVAYGLFGLADTLASYDHINTCTKSIMDSDINYATFQKAQFYKYNGLMEGIWDSSDCALKDEDFEKIEKNTGIKVVGAYVPQTWETNDPYGNSVNTFQTQYDTGYEFTKTDYHIYAYGFSGYATLDQEMLDASGFHLIAGRLADGSKDEMVISSYIAQTFMLAGYREYQENEESTTRYETIKEPADMVGKTIRIDGVDMEIVGVVDTGFDLDRYKSLTEENKGLNSMDLILQTALNGELQKARELSFLQMIMVGDGYIQKVQERNSKICKIKPEYFISYHKGEEYDFYPDTLSRLDQIDQSKVIWLGEPKKSLSKNEIILTQDCLEQAAEMKGIGLEELLKDPIELNYQLGKSERVGEGWEEETELEDTVQVVGYLPYDSTSLYDGVVLDDQSFEKLAYSEKGKYTFAIGAMPKSASDVKKIVKYAYTGKGGVRYTLQNSVTYELDGLDAVFKALSKIFVRVGIFFAIFASVMMATFISSSIAYKKQEIGILRAIGARGSDVFRIFFSESFVIAMINFVLSTIGVFIATLLVNRLARRSTGLLVTILNFDLRQVGLLFLVSIAVAAVASFLPVNHNARKRPIDAIRNR